MFRDFTVATTTERDSLRTLISGGTRPGLVAYCLADSKYYEYQTSGAWSQLVGTTGSDIPLSKTRAIDYSTTVATADQNGSSAKPYKTIAQGVADLTTGGTLLIVPSTGYATEADVTASSTNAISFVNVAGLQFLPGQETMTYAQTQMCSLPNIIGTAPKYFQGCVTKVVASSGVIRFVGCHVKGLVTTTTDVFAWDCHMQLSTAETNQVTCRGITCVDTLIDIPLTFVTQSTGGTAKYRNCEMYTDGGVLSAFGAGNGQVDIDEFTLNACGLHGVQVVSGSGTIVINPTAGPLRGTLAATGATPVVVPCLQMTANSFVAITPTSGSTTYAWRVTKQAGVSFTFVSSSGDTQNYDYLVL
jgi:hypothetical protein